jgi:hypothetical protein
MVGLKVSVLHTGDQCYLQLIPVARLACHAQRQSAPHLCACGSCGCLVPLHITSAVLRERLLHVWDNKLCRRSSLLR